MRKPVSIAAILFVACQARLPETAPPRKSPDPRKSAMSERSYQPICRILSAPMAGYAGPDAIDCNRQATLEAATACMRTAFQARHPFTLCHGGPTMDSWAESGIVGLPSGAIEFFYFDTMGPAYRGICLRQNVVLLPGGPQCRRELQDQIDLRTGLAHEELSDRRGESWPAACAVHALASIRGSPPVRFRSDLPITPDRFGIWCRKYQAWGEVLIDRNGRVECMRIISGSDDPPIPELREQIRANVTKWRFAPVTVGGDPVEARSYFEIRHPCP